MILCKVEIFNYMYECSVWCDYHTVLYKYIHNICKAILGERFECQHFHTFTRNGKIWMATMTINKTTIIITHDNGLTTPNNNAVYTKTILCMEYDNRYTTSRAYIINKYEWKSVYRVIVRMCTCLMCLLFAGCTWLNLFEDNFPFI